MKALILCFKFRAGFVELAQDVYLKNIKNKNLNPKTLHM